MNKHTKTTETFQVTTGHCIAGMDREVTQVSLPKGWTKNPAGALRDAGLLCRGQRVREYRFAGDGVCVVFPGKVPGLSSSITHSITLHPSLGCLPAKPTE